MQEATGWMRLGQPGRAVALFEREIGGLPPTERVDAGVFRARLARAYAQDDRPDCAAKTALAAYELATVTGSWRARCELALVRKTIGRHHHDAAAARFAAVFDAGAEPALSAGRRQQ